MNIAIDGPAGAGKSTIAKLVASALGITYLDTGAMYRAVAVKVLRQGVRLDDEAAVTQILLSTELDVRIASDGAQHIYLDGDDVSELIREPHISKAASKVSALPAVRHRMVELQRELAAKGDTVLDGRDIGTFVLPDAAYKFFLTADAKERANRRYKELIQKGAVVTFESVLSDIVSRDRNDSERALAPLKKAEDAIEVDTTSLTVEQAVQKVLSYVR